MSGDAAGVCAVEAVRISRAFGGVRAVSEASLAARAGEVHALVGENGAGKSTLIKILGGRIRPDAGQIRIRGREVQLSGPDAGHALGVWTVFQELTLLPSMTVAENLLLKREPRSRLGFVDRRRLFAAAEEVLAGLGIAHVDPRAEAGDIPLAERQLVEIVRAISHEPAILLLDEPTSSLVEREVAWLFGQIRRLAERGTAVLFTSHRWNEISSIADRITVFRSGRDVGSFTTLAEDEAVTLMTGQRMDTFYPALPGRRPDDEALRVSRLHGPRVRDVSLTLRAGEILGVGGLAGHGHRELFFMLFGAERAQSGSLAVAGRRVRIRSPRDAVRSGVGLALVPEDRKTEGLLLAMSIRDNMTLSVLPKLSRAGLLQRRREHRLAAAQAARLKVRMAGLGSPVGALSGGNQQKVLVGRWLLVEPRVLLLYDVTRGVDVATKHEIYELIMALAGEGCAILFYSSDAEELAHLCHRVLVMREGRVAAELAAPGISAEQVVAAAMRDPLAA